MLGLEDYHGIQDEEIKLVYLLGPVSAPKQVLIRASERTKARSSSMLVKGSTQIKVKHDSKATRSVCMMNVRYKSKF